MLRLMRMICAVVILFGILSPTAYGHRHGGVRTGEWGGYGIVMQVELSSASIGFDCAEGSINQPITLDRHRHFDVAGIYTPYSIAIVVGQPPPATRPARYFGYIHGKNMFVTVQLTDTMEIIGTFVLTYGQSPSIVHCA